MFLPLKRLTELLIKRPRIFFKSISWACCKRPRFWLLNRLPELVVNAHDFCQLNVTEFVVNAQDFCQLNVTEFSINAHKFCQLNVTEFAVNNHGFSQKMIDWVHYWRDTILLFRIFTALIVKWPWLDPFAVFLSYYSPSIWAYPSFPLPNINCYNHVIGQINCYVAAMLIARIIATTMSKDNSFLLNINFHNDVNCYNDVNSQ